MSVEGQMRSRLFRLGSEVPGDFSRVNPLALLRPRRERPRGRRAAEQRYELAVPHSNGKDSTSRYGTRPVRCGISIQPMSQMGHKQTFAPSLGQVRFATRKRTSIGAAGMSA